MFRNKRKKRINLKKIRAERNRKICEVFENLLADGLSTNKAINEIALIYCLTPEGIKKILKQKNVYRTTGHIKKEKEVIENNE